MVLEKIKIEKGQVGKQIKKEDLKEESKETWANKLFNKEEDSYRKKIKLEVQGSQTVENRIKGWACAPVELFVSNTDVETSEQRKMLRKL